ncbi:sigma-70 family RNA polymerase sigma factor [Jeotgalibacillus sp. ET6]|uniref:sigma-70 family RNA polymerase sigma factor n=1 Tax=Jeotgalibacillus sp. ET6 TaxID=3037260 RepID=UPI0024183278|nr:sigma-70 family RNA polymerase sigma factor [Jeotgalibacillus sp. ET6]MDG5471470.1 sigma-70 family RNA polymerase sigma factor [Jeotgalibacillus sp. ET6]
MNSFDEVFAQFEPMIFHMIRKLNIRQDHEVFIQEGMLSLWRAWEKFDPAQGEFAPYAYQCIRGGMLTYMRSDNRRKERESVHSEEFWEMREDAAPDPAFQSDIFNSCAKLLTPTQQKWFWLTFEKDLSVAQIAEQEGVSVSAVKKWKKGAVTKLKVSLSDQLE